MIKQTSNDKLNSDFIFPKTNLKEFKENNEVEQVLLIKGRNSVVKNKSPDNMEAKAMLRNKPQDKNEDKGIVKNKFVDKVEAKTSELKKDLTRTKVLTNRKTQLPNKSELSVTNLEQRNATYLKENKAIIQPVGSNFE